MTFANVSEKLLVLVIRGMIAIEEVKVVSII